MDWSKAKNILIMAFIVTNIFLAYELFNADKEEDKLLVEQEFITDVKTLLLNENIKIDAKIPNKIPTLSPVSIEYETYDSREVSSRFFKDYTEEYLVGVKKYVSEGKSLEFFSNNKKLVFRDTSLDVREKKPISKSEAEEILLDFLEKRGFSLEDAQLSFYEEKDLIHTFEYSKVIGDVPLEETSMRLMVSSEGVHLFERYWMKNVKEENRVLTPSSASKALLRLLTRSEYYGKTIVDIDICYFFNTNRYVESVGFKQSTGGVAVPTWRFIFSDGEKAFLEEN